MTMSHGVLVVLSLVVLQTGAAPRGLSLSQAQKLTAKQSKTEPSTKVSYADLGKLSTVHAVGLATNPSDDSTLIYADETALYEFNKATGESILLAGGESSGLLADREPVDGDGSSAAFKYITKLISRETGLYVFDYNTLRKYDFNTKAITTLSSLSEDTSESNPITGVVSRDEKLVYWTTTAGEGHLLMSMQVGGSLDDAEFITGGPTLVGHMELSPDEDFILLADVDMEVVEKVKVSDGSIEFVTQYGDANFFPGSMVMVDDKLMVINRALQSVNLLDISETHPTAEDLCDTACASSIKNPFDIAYDSESSEVYILDTEFHPSLPTYIFSIKRVSLAREESTDSVAANRPDFNNMLQFYAKWFATRSRS